MAHHLVVGAPRWCPSVHCRRYSRLTTALSLGILGYPRRRREVRRPLEPEFADDAVVALAAGVGAGAEPSSWHGACRGWVTMTTASVRCRESCVPR
jgi:hypothetical protein